MADKKAIESSVKELAERVASTFGFEVVDVEFKSGNNSSLTIFIDKENGINLDDCEVFHNAVDLPLDELDPTCGKPYTLNVSSPGLDRPFKTDRDYEKHLGQKIEVRLYAPLQGQKYFEGILADFDQGTITLELPKSELKLERTRIAKANVAIEFD